MSKNVYGFKQYVRDVISDLRWFHFLFAIIFFGYLIGLSKVFDYEAQKSLERNAYKSEIYCDKNITFIQFSENGKSWGNFLPNSQGKPIPCSDNR